MIRRPTRQVGLRPARRSPNPGREHARLAVCLTGRDRWILHMVHEHRVLTTTQISALGFTHLDLARRRLATLRDYGVLDRFRPLRTTGSAPSHWVLAPGGAAVLAAEAGLDVRDLHYRPDRALAIAHSLHLAHTVGIAEWFTTLTAASLYRPDTSVLSWWSQTRCHALWGDLARPDAYGRYTRTGATLDFFLEFDLGTMALPTVATKLLGYADLARTTGVITPVLVWTPTAAREAAARKLLHDTWTRLPDPDAVPVATAAAELLDPAAARPSPADRVWLPLTTSTRRSLHELPAGWPRATTAPATVPVPPASRHALLAAPPPTPPARGAR
ncbi:replication-relaxation family protein [Nocardia sp. CC227C]|uniref:replication-relaxation family protein n=1 Tax=Nocardia sp. CC227C TaxID=3044562 RepID=UPI00278BBB57|nr:replication-relaxation family protein [Nocardia sp. CC227C]